MKDNSELKVILEDIFINEDVLLEVNLSSAWKSLISFISKNKTDLNADLNAEKMEITAGQKKIQKGNDVDSIINNQNKVFPKTIEIDPLIVKQIKIKYNNSEPKPNKLQLIVMIASALYMAIKKNKDIIVSTESTESSEKSVGIRETTKKITFSIIALITSICSIFYSVTGEKISAMEVAKMLQDSTIKTFADMFSADLVPSNINDILVNVTDKSDKRIEQINTEKENLPSARNPLLSKSSYDSSISNLESQLAAATDVAAKEKIQKDIDDFQKLSKENKKILDRLYYSLDQEQNKLEKTKLVAKNLTEALGTDDKAFTQTLRKEVISDIKVKALEKITSNFAENEKNIAELKTTKRYDLDSGKATLNNEKERARVLKNLEDSNYKMALFHKILNKLDPEKPDTFSSLMTENELNKCAVVIAHSSSKEKNLQTGIGCTNLINDKGEWIDFENIEDFIRINKGQLNKSYNQVLDFYYPTGFQSWLEKAKNEKIDYTTDDNKEKMKSGISAIVDNLQGKTIEEAQKDLNFWKIMYQFAKSDTDVRAAVSVKKQLDDYKRWISDSAFRQDKIKQYITSNIGQKKVKKSEIPSVTKQINLALSGTFKFTNVESDPNSAQKGEVEQALTTLELIGESSSRKWDSLLSVIEENYFKRS